MAPTAIVDSVYQPSDPTASFAQLGGLRRHYFAANLASQVLTSNTATPKSKQKDDEDEVIADPQAPSERPQISFEPSWEEYQQRVAKLKKERHQCNQAGTGDLPAGFPLLIEGPRVWSAAKDSETRTVKLDEFIVSLEAREIKEIEEALVHYLALPGKNGPDQMTKELFPLPTLEYKLDAVSEEVHSGRGMVVLRGLEAGKYTDLENIILYVGLSSHIGERRGCQDRGGTMLTHITSRAKRDETAPAYTTAGLPFHSDVCDILALYARESAIRGGEISFASSAAVYNEIAASRPDVIKLLAGQIWCYDSARPLLPDWPRRQILHLEPEHGPLFMCSRRKLTGSNDMPLSFSVPVMSEAQAEALDMVHFVAEKHSLSWKMESGDILFANNLALLHAREAYTESYTNPKKRHLMRLWLRNEKKAWNTPQGLQEDWFNVYGDSERRSLAFWTISPDDLDMDQFLKPKMTCPT